MKQPITSGVIVTGGASGIGKACAEYLAEAGRPVAVWDLNGGGAKQVADSLGVPAVGLEVDVADEAALRDAVAATREALPSIGGMVHSAGMVDPSPIGVIDWGRWQRLLDINLTAHARIVQLILPTCWRPCLAPPWWASPRSKASSVTARSPRTAPRRPGLIGLTRSLADALGPQGVRANAVCPGYIRTPMLSSTPEMDERNISASVLRRMGDPEEIAGVVRFLLSADASFITGQAIVADGGVTAVDQPLNLPA